MKLGIAIEILKILLNNSIVTAESIGVRCGIHRRSVYRYIDELTVCGIPIQTNRGKVNGGIYLPADYKQQKNALMEKLIIN